MGLTGVAMETMRPSGPVKLESIESGIYKEVGLIACPCLSNIACRGQVLGLGLGLSWKTGRHFFFEPWYRACGIARGRGRHGV